MSNHHRLTRRETESTLDAPVESASRLEGLLGALRAPGRPGELRREDAAVAAFHTARLEPITRTPRVLSTPRRAATRAVVATGVVVTLTSGGFALAATDNLPTLPGQASDQATASVAKDRAAVSESATQTLTPVETVPTALGGPGRESTAPMPSASFVGLCRAYQNGNRQARGTSLDSAAFIALATEAGGSKSIAPYCVTVIGEPKLRPVRPTKPTQGATPAKPAQPTAQPTAEPSRVATPAKPTTIKPTPVKPTPVKPTPVKPTPVTPTRDSASVTPTRDSTPTTPATTEDQAPTTATDAQDAKGKPAGAGRP